MLNQLTSRQVCLSISNSSLAKDVGEKAVLVDADLTVNQTVESVGIEAQKAVLKVVDSVGVRARFRMLEHRVLRIARMESDDPVVLVHQASVQVVVLTAPALKQVREAIDVNKGLGCYRHGTAEQSVVRQVEAKRVEAAAHVTRSGRAGVDVAQI